MERFLKPEMNQQIIFHKMHTTIYKSVLVKLKFPDREQSSDLWTRSKISITDQYYYISRRICNKVNRLKFYDSHFKKFNFSERSQSSHGSFKSLWIAN